MNEEEADKHIIEKKKELMDEFGRKHEERLAKEKKPLWFTNFYLDKLKKLCPSDDEIIELAALIELAMDLGRIVGMQEVIKRIDDEKERVKQKVLHERMGSMYA
mgnify:CR=1 FL=1